jgi:hypothetical protein
MTPLALTGTVRLSLTTVAVVAAPAPEMVRFVESEAALFSVGEQIGSVTLAANT